MIYGHVRLGVPRTSLPASSRGLLVRSNCHSTLLCGGPSDRLVILRPESLCQLMQVAVPSFA